jgi:hypothetical protein
MTDNVRPDIDRQALLNKLDKAQRPEGRNGAAPELAEPTGPPLAADIDFTKPVALGWVSSPMMAASSGTSAFTVDTPVSLGYSGSGKKILRIEREPQTDIVRMLVEKFDGVQHWYLLWPSGQIAEVLDQGWKKP